MLCYNMSFAYKMIGPMLSATIFKIFAMVILSIFNLVIAFENNANCNVEYQLSNTHMLNVFLMQKITIKTRLIQK